MCDCSSCENYKEKEKSAFQKWDLNTPKIYPALYIDEDIVRARKEGWNAAIVAAYSYFDTNARNCDAQEFIYTLKGNKALTDLVEP
jgi:hypothetical protein